MFQFLKKDTAEHYFSVGVVYYVVQFLDELFSDDSNGKRHV